MSITNTVKVSSSLTNAAKVAGYETWATIGTTWLAETRTWLAMGTIFTNTSRQSSTMTNTPK